MASPDARPPEVEPLDVDGVRAVAVGTAVWAALFLALLPFRGRLDEAGHAWWLWTCLAGTGLGLLGLEYCRVRRDRLAARGSPTPLPPPGPASTQS